MVHLMQSLRYLCDYTRSASRLLLHAETRKHLKMMDVPLEGDLARRRELNPHLPAHILRLSHTQTAEHGGSVH